MPAIEFEDDWHDAWVLQNATRARAGVWPGAVSASVLLHILVFGLLITLTFPAVNDLTAPDETREGITITLVRPSTIPEETQVSSGAIVDSNAIEISPPEPETAGNDDVVLDPVITEEVLQPQPTDKVVETETRDDGQESFRAITTPTGIRQAITSFVESQDGELHRAYVESCIRYRNRHGVASDCPENELSNISSYDEEKQVADEIFANVTRKTDDARLTAKLERENELLYAMMSDSGNPAREQSAISFRLNEQYRRYLTGNRSEGLYNIDMMTMALGNDYGRTTFAVPYQFRCKVRPCVYKYTGFSVERPEYVAEELDKFTRQTPLFIPSD